MKLLRTSLLFLCGCGVSTAELSDDPRARSDSASIDYEVPGGPRRDTGRAGATPDAGQPIIIELFPDAGAPETPRDGGGPNPEEHFPDAGLPETPRDAGQPETPRDAGIPRECVPMDRRACSTTCGSTSTQVCDGTGAWARCQIPSEVCGDGVDNDCDGRTDDRDTDCPPPRRRCEDTEGGSCNGDPGYGNRCSPADNTGGCSAARFHAWCNRRNPAYPDIWDNWIRNWVDSRCDGTVQETGTQYSTWYCTSSNNERFECTTPLVLSFDGAKVTFERTHGEFAFTPGRAVHSDWPSAVTPWLARDVNGNGRIDDGSELFGSDTRLPDGRTATNGFEALAALDGNDDGVVDAKDPAFSSLLVWRDADGDKRSTKAELEPLKAAGVTALATRFDVEPRCDARGNCERERGVFTTRAGKSGVLVDVHLRVREAQRSGGALTCRAR